MGIVFHEQFWVENMYSCCNPSLSPGAGFHIIAETDRYNLLFDYEKNKPNMKSNNWLAAQLFVNRGNHGFRVALDENFEVRMIQEIGGPTVLLGSCYEEDDFKAGTGKAIYESIINILEKMRQEFNIEERIKECDGLTSEELKRAEQVVAYMTGCGRFPLIKSAERVNLLK